MLLLSTLIVYAGGYVVLLFAAVCLAAGLYYLAELVEEFCSTAKRVIGTCIQAVLVLHVLTLLLDRIPFWPIAVGICTHSMYWQLLSTFPYISVSSPLFLGSLGMLVVSHITWIRCFMLSVHVSAEWSLGFLIVMLWLVPFSLLISLSANDNVLPTASSGAQWGTSTSGSGAGRKRKSVMLMLFELLKQIRNNSLPSRKKIELTMSARAAKAL